MSDHPTRRNVTLGAAAALALPLPQAASSEAPDALAVRLASDYLNNTGALSIAPAAALLTGVAATTPDVWYARGMVARASGDHESALTAFRQMPQDDYRAHGQIGMSLINLGKLPDAVEHLTIALRTADPSRAGVYAYNFGRAHFFAEQYEQAVPWFWRALQTRPELSFIAPYLVASLDYAKAPQIARDVLRTHADYTLDQIIADEMRNPTGSEIMREARSRLHDSLARLGCATTL